MTTLEYNECETCGLHFHEDSEACPKCNSAKVHAVDPTPIRSFFEGMRAGINAQVNQVGV